MFLRSTRLIDIYPTEKSKRFAIGFVSCIIGIALGGNASRYTLQKNADELNENSRNITTTVDKKSVIKKVYSITGQEIISDNQPKTIPDSIIMIYSK